MVYSIEEELPGGTRSNDSAQIKGELFPNDLPGFGLAPMSRAFGPSEGMKYPSSREGGGLAGHEYPSSAQHSLYYPPPAYPPNSHEYHSTASPHGTLPPPPYATAYSGYEMTGYGGPPTSFDSNGSPHPPQSGGPYPPHHHGYMASYPPYFAGPWTVVPPPTLIIDITPGDILCGRGGATNAHVSCNLPPFAWVSLARSQSHMSLFFFQRAATERFVPSSRIIRRSISTPRSAINHPSHLIL